MNNSIGIGIVGLGYWGPNLLRNFMIANQCEVLYGCDLDETLLHKQQTLYPAVTFTKNYTELLEDANVQLIVVATRTEGHYSLAKQALLAGKNVFIEKPMTSTLEQAKELNAIAKENNLQIFIDHTFAFAASVEKIVEYVNSDLGDLLYFDSTRINLGIIQQDTNVLWDLAIHDLSILATIKDLDTIETIYATGSAHFGTQIEVGHLHIQFNDGFTAHIHVSWLSPVKIRQTIIAGTKAMLLYDDTDPSEKVRLYDKGVDNQPKVHNPFNPTYRSGDIIIPALDTTETLLKQANHIIDCLHGNATPRVSGEEGLKIVKILTYANESLQSQQKVQYH